MEASYGGEQSSDRGGGSAIYMDGWIMGSIILDCIALYVSMKLQFLQKIFTTNVANVEIKTNL